MLTQVRNSKGPVETVPGPSQLWPMAKRRVAVRRGVWNTRGTQPEAERR